MHALHIDVGAILETAQRPVYNDLVTRATGRAVRSGIEARLAREGVAPLTIIDLSRVGLIDFSCADEIVATLVRRALGPTPGYEGCFVVDGVTDDHLDAIEQVLERDGLALVARTVQPGVHRLVGVVDARERAVWELVVRECGADATLVATRLALALEEAAAALAALVRRRLLLADGAWARPPFGAVA
jgi:hypothetical protein